MSNFADILANLRAYIADSPDIASWDASHIEHELDALEALHNLRLTPSWDDDHCACGHDFASHDPDRSGCEALGLCALCHPDDDVVDPSLDDHGAPDSDGFGYD